MIFALLLLIGLSSQSQTVPFYEYLKITQKNNVEDFIETPADTLAFPTATGAGANASGGRGYPIYYVNNLNDSGVGSFRQALLDCESNGGGNVYFNVSGTIILNGLLNINNLENVSIWGQTAPAGGITIGGTGSINGDWVLAPKILINRARNLIWVYTRFRQDFVSSNHDNLIINDGKNFIIDHCSFAFGTDEGLDTTNLCDNFTIQYCTFNACKTGQIVGSSDDITHTSSVSFNNNLFYNTSHRFANASVSGRYDNINNLVWNFNSRIMVLQGDGLKMNQINNYYTSIYGDINTLNPTFSFGRRGVQYIWDDGSAGTVTTAPQFYTSGNFIKDTSPYEDFDQYVWRFSPPLISGYIANFEGDLPSSFEKSIPFPLINNNFDIKTALEVKAHLPLLAGANAVLNSNGTKISDIDFVDQIAIDNIINDNQVYYNQIFDRTQLLEIGYAETFWNTFSTTPINTRNDDFNLDGIPDGLQSLLPPGKLASDLDENGVSYREQIYLYNVYREQPTLGVSNNVVKSYKIYPNPTKGIFYIKPDDFYQVTVYDIQGRFLTNNLDLTFLPPGIYVVKIKMGLKEINKKIVKI